MKKFLLFIAVTTLGFGAMAQGKSHGKGNKNKQEKHHNKKNHDDDNDDRYDRNQQNNGNNDGVYRRDNDNNDRYENRNNNQNGKYSKNTPRRVSDAFYRDYPNASNVSWTKDRGVWTARFNSGGIFGGNNTASYQANGQRVGSNNNNTVFGRNRQTNRNTQTQQKRGGTFTDRVLRRQQ